MGTTIPCQDQTHERLEELRGDQYKNWDAFLNHLADIWEQRETIDIYETGNDEPVQTIDGGPKQLTNTQEMIQELVRDVDDVKDLVDRVPERTADRIREDFQ